MPSIAPALRCGAGATAPLRPPSRPPAGDCPPDPAPPADARTGGAGPFGRTLPRPRLRAKPAPHHGTAAPARLAASAVRRSLSRAGSAAATLAAPSLAALGGLLLLAGCDSDPNRFPPACPAASLVADAADLTRFDGRGQDLTDMVADGKIVALAGRCRQSGDGRTLRTTVTVSLDLSRGPAARGRVEPVSYFVAVTRGEQILDKQTFDLRVAFPPNTDIVHVSGDPVQLDLPTPPGTSGATYRILVGFQLTPEQMALNRRRGMR